MVRGFSSTIFTLLTTACSSSVLRKYESKASYCSIRRKCELGSEYRSVRSCGKDKDEKCKELGGRSKPQEHIEMVKVGKEWCKCGEVFMICAGSGSREAAVQIEDWLSWVV